MNWGCNVSNEKRRTDSDYRPRAGLGNLAFLRPLPNDVKPVRSQRQRVISATVKPSATVIGPSRHRLAIYAAGSLVFAIGSLHFLDATTHPWLRPLSLALFGGGGVALLIGMLPGCMSLMLDSEGFTVTNFFRRRYYRWSDIESFFIAVISTVHGSKTRFVSFNLLPHARTGRIMPKLNSFIAGCDYSLPNFLNLSDDYLLERMNDGLRTWLVSQLPPMLRFERNNATVIRVQYL